MAKKKPLHPSLVPKPPIKALVQKTTPLSSSVTPNTKRVSSAQNKEKTPSQINFFQTPSVVEMPPIRSRKRKCIGESAMGKDEMIEMAACILSLHDSLTARSQNDELIAVKLVSFNEEYGEDLTRFVEWYNPQDAKSSTKELLIQSEIIYGESDGLAERLQTIKKKLEGIEKGSIENLPSKPLSELFSGSCGSSSSASSLGAGRGFFQTPPVIEPLPSRPRKRRKCIRESAMSKEEIIEMMTCILSLHDNLTERSQNDGFIAASLVSFNEEYGQDLTRLIEWYGLKGTNLPAKELLIEPEVIYETPDGLSKRLQTIKKKLKDIEEGSVRNLSTKPLSELSSSSSSGSSSSSFLDSGRGFFQTSSAQQAAEKNDDIAKKLQILLGDRQNMKPALL